MEHDAPGRDGPVTHDNRRRAAARQRGGEIDVDVGVGLDVAQRPARVGRRRHHLDAVARKDQRGQAVVVAADRQALAALDQLAVAIDVQLDVVGGHRERRRAHGDGRRGPRRQQRHQHRVDRANHGRGAAAPVSHLPVLPVEQLDDERVGVHAFEAAQVDVDLARIGPRRVERVDAAVAAELVLRDARVERVDSQVVGAGQQLELVGRHDEMQEALLAADRTIATFDRRGVEIGRDAKPDPTTVATTVVNGPSSGTLACLSIPASRARRSR